MSADGAPAVHSNQVATIPTWGPAFRVEFLLYINSFDGPNLKNGKFAELIRFSSRDGNCCAVGNRIPAILTDRGGFIQVATQIGNQGNKWKNVRLNEKIWYSLEIIQGNHDHHHHDRHHPGHSDDKVTHMSHVGNDH